MNNTLLQLQLVHLQNVATVNKLYNEYVELEASLQTINRLNISISTYGFTGAIDDLLGNELKAIISLEALSDKPETELNKLSSKIKGRILTISKSIIDSSKNFLFTTVDDMYVIINQVEDRISTVNKFEKIVFTNTPSTVNKPHVDLIAVTKLLPNIDKHLKETFKMLGKNNWFNSKIKFVGFDIDYVNSLKKAMEQTDEISYLSDGISETIENIETDIKALKYILKSIHTIVGNMKLSNITEFNIGEDERDPIEIIRLCNLMLFNIIKYTFLHIQNHVNIVNNLQEGN